MLGYADAIATIPAPWRRQDTVQVEYPSTVPSGVEAKSFKFSGVIGSGKDDELPLLSKSLLLPDAEVSVEAKKTSESNPSLNYQRFNTKSFISNLKKEISKWLEFGTENSLIYIANIKDAINTNRNILRRVTESRLLVSTLDLVFDNNNWSNVKPSQLNRLIAELDRFEDGSVSVDSLKKFSLELFRSGISTIKPIPDEKVKEEIKTA